MKQPRGQYPPNQHSATVELNPLSSRYSSALESPFFSPRTHDSRRRWKWKLRNFASKFWLWEMFACLISLGVAGVIYWQLKTLDGQLIWYWDYGWSPTSGLAFAVTITKASMMIPVASALGQLKWHWFRTSRKLDGMEHFDEASRGVLGSLRLLWRLKFWRLASVGAFITICTLSLDALSQNAVQVISVPSNTYGCYVARTNTFNVSSRFSQRKKDLPPSDMLSAIYYAITTVGMPNLEQGLFECASGQCDFGTYDSLAIDYQCISSDITKNGSIVQHPGLTDPYFYLDTTSGIIQSNTTRDLPDSGDFHGLGPLISRWLVLANPSTINPEPLGMDCAFYWTINTYHSEVMNSSFREEINSTWTNETTESTHKEDIYLIPDSCWRNNISISKTDAEYPDCTNIVYNFAHRSLQSWFDLSDFSLTGWGLNDTQSTDKRLYWDFTSIFMQAIMANLTDSNQTEVANTIRTTAKRLSSAMTTLLRQKPLWTTNTTSFYGISNGTTIWPEDVFYQIRWEYLIFPFVLVGISTVFFLATVIFTRGEGGWKSSQLAVIFHGLSENDAKAVGNVRGYADMRELGRDMQVQLVETDTGKKLVSREVLMGM
ncbi:uncharacterized protein BDR25DRAFT_129425 [Lindgomyces ingoldianus]|uniref:Uncharacterized protein n=1 Tax=Lindgomyces ingoldianus TaxID=673940 RepID=A0ACB6R1H9_9PLEO|nr:uncharacterized protein BDR25DRAFT_129425 [Lindgomyces ingoldianus]KAF2473179.1 hypothetical protein BDR25DRAFT_129425 [Lindgomyces ingoldianus]